MQDYMVFALHHWQMCLALVVLLLFILSLELHTKITGSQAISVQATVLLINRENALIVDVRDPSSYSRGHIAGSLNISIPENEADFKKIELQKNKPIILVGAQGMIPYKLAKLFKRKGFENLYHLKGGFAAWQAAGFMVEKK